jgi:hypothetical protein
MNQRDVNRRWGNRKYSLPPSALLCQRSGRFPSSLTLIIRQSRCVVVAGQGNSGTVKPSGFQVGAVVDIQEVPRERIFLRGGMLPRRRESTSHGMDDQSRGFAAA